MNASTDPASAFRAEFPDAPPPLQPGQAVTNLDVIAQAVIAEQKEEKDGN